jgi:TonB family protein
LRPSSKQPAQPRERIPFEQSLLRSAPGARPSSLLGSVALHALVVTAALFVSSLDQRIVRKEDYRILPAPSSRKLTWYRMDKRLPELSVGSKVKLTAPRPRKRSNEVSIQASVPKAPAAPQLIIQPEAQEVTKKTLKLPNMAAFRPPPPPPPPPKPELEMPQLPAQQAAVPAAPPPIVPMMAPPKPAPRKFTPPPPPKREPPKQVDLTELPPPAVQSAKGLGDLTAVVAGVRPAMSDAPMLPDVSRPASVSVGPAPGQRGAGGGAAALSPVEGLELITKGGAQSAAGIQSTYVAQTIFYTREVVDQRRQATSVPVRLAMLPPPAQQVFGERTVYLAFLDKLNAANYASEVLMWFAERGQTAQGGQAMHAPVPFRQTDPLGPQSKVGQAIQGVVRIAGVVGKDGFVSALRLVEGPDDRVNKALLTAAEKWTFLPALRGQDRIEVDVMFDIPVALKVKAAVEASR